MGFRELSDITSKVTAMKLLAMGIFQIELRKLSMICLLEKTTKGVQGYGFLRRLRPPILRGY